MRWLRAPFAPSLAAETAAVFEQMGKYHPTEPHGTWP